MNRKKAHLTCRNQTWPTTRFERTCQLRGTSQLVINVIINLMVISLNENEANNEMNIYQCQPQVYIDYSATIHWKCSLLFRQQKNKQTKRTGKTNCWNARFSFSIIHFIDEYQFKALVSYNQRTRQCTLVTPPTHTVNKAQLGSNHTVSSLMKVYVTSVD